MSNFEDFHNTIIEHVYANFHNGNVKINPLFKIWLDFFQHQPLWKANIL